MATTVLNQKMYWRKSKEAKKPSYFELKPPLWEEIIPEQIPVETVSEDCEKAEWKELS